VLLRELALSQQVPQEERGQGEQERPVRAPACRWRQPVPPPVLPVLVEQQLVPLAVLQGLAQGPPALRVLVPEQQGLPLLALRGLALLALRGLAQGLVLLVLRGLQVLPPAVLVREQ